MRSHRLIMPPAKLNVKISQTRAYPCCRIARFCGVIVNMGVITFDDTLCHKTPLPERVSILLPNLLWGNNTKGSGRAKRRQDGGLGYCHREKTFRPHYFRNNLVGKYVLVARRSE